MLLYVCSAGIKISTGSCSAICARNHFHTNNKNKAGDLGLYEWTTMRENVMSCFSAIDFRIIQYHAFDMILLFALFLLIVVVIRFANCKISGMVISAAILFNQLFF